MLAPLLPFVDVLVGGLAAVVQPADSPAGIAAIALAAAAALLLTLILTRRAIPLPAYGAFIASAVRQHSVRTAFLPLRDPDAAGLPRPRAPSALIRAA